MSLCIGIILPESVDTKTLLQDEALQIDLQPNPTVTVEHMLPNERLYCVPQNGTMDNSLTGIGSYVVYSQDITEFKKQLSKYPAQYQKMMMDDLTQWRQNYLKDANEWVERIRLIVSKIHIMKLFLYMFDDGDCVHIQECRKCTLVQLNRDYLMKVPNYTMVTFSDEK